MVTVIFSVTSHLYADLCITIITVYKISCLCSLAYNLGSILTLRGHINICYAASLTTTWVQAYLCKTGLQHYKSNVRFNIFVFEFHCILPVVTVQMDTSSSYVKNGLMHPWHYHGRGKFTKCVKHIIRKILASIA